MIYLQNYKHIKKTIIQMNTMISEMNEQIQTESNRHLTDIDLNKLIISCPIGTNFVCESNPLDCPTGTNLVCESSMLSQTIFELHKQDQNCKHPSRAPMITPYQRQLDQLQDMISKREQQIKQTTSVCNYQFLFAHDSSLMTNSTGFTNCMGLYSMISLTDVLKLLIESNNNILINQYGTKKAITHPITGYDTSQSIKKDNIVIISNYSYKLIKQLYGIDNCVSLNQIQEDLRRLVTHKNTQYLEKLVYCVQNSFTTSFIVFNNDFFNYLQQFQKQDRNKILLYIESKFGTFFLDNVFIKQFQNIYSSKSTTYEDETDYNYLKKFLSGNYTYYDQLSEFAKELLKESAVDIKIKLNLLIQPKIRYQGICFKKVIIYNFEFIDYSCKILGQIVWLISNKSRQNTQQKIVLHTLLDSQNDNIEPQDISLIKCFQKINVQRILLSSTIRKLHKYNNNHMILPSQQLNTNIYYFKSHNISNFVSSLLLLNEQKNTIKKNLSQIRQIQPSSQQDVFLKLCSSLNLFIGSRDQCQHYITNNICFYILKAKAFIFYKSLDQDIQLLQSKIDSSFKSLYQLNTRFSNISYECNVCMKDQDNTSNQTIFAIYPCCQNKICVQCFFNYVDTTYIFNCVFCRQPIQIQQMTILYDNTTYHNNFNYAINHHNINNNHMIQPSYLQHINQKTQLPFIQQITHILQHIYLNPNQHIQSKGIQPISSIQTDQQLSLAATLVVQHTTPFGCLNHLFKKNDLQCEACDTTSRGFALQNNLLLEEFQSRSVLQTKSLYSSNILKGEAICDSSYSTYMRSKMETVSADNYLSYGASYLKVQDNIETNFLLSQFSNLPIQIPDLLDTDFINNIYTNIPHTKTAIFYDDPSFIPSINIIQKIIDYQIYSILKPNIQTIEDIANNSNDTLFSYINNDICQIQHHNHQFNNYKYTNIKQQCNQFNSIQSGIVVMYISPYIDFELLDFYNITNILLIHNNKNQSLELQQQLIQSVLHQKHFNIDFQFYDIYITHDDNAENKCI